MTNNFFLLADVNIKITPFLIEFKKGIFNYNIIQINNDNNFEKDEFTKFLQKITTLKQTKHITVNSDDKNYYIFANLQKYNFITIKTTTFDITHLITNFKNTAPIKKIFTNFNKAKSISFFHINKLKKITNTTVVVLINEFNLIKLKTINKLFLANNVKAIYLLSDGNFIHALYVDTDFTGCFECFTLRMLAKINDSTDLNAISTSNFDTNLEHNSSNLFLLLALTNSIIESSQKYHSLLLASKVFSIYLPTFELHIDKLLKISLCETCGFYSKKQSQELNINLKEVLKELMNND